MARAGATEYVMMLALVGLAILAIIAIMGVAQLQDVNVRQRLDNHALERHGVQALTAVTALRLCDPAQMEAWHCPTFRSDIVDVPESIVLICPGEAGKVAVGMVSVRDIGTGNVLLTCYIADGASLYRRLQARGCRPVRVNVRWLWGMIGSAPYREVESPDK